MSSKEPLHVGHIVARLLSVRLPMGLVLDEVIVQGEDLTLTKHPISIKLDQPGSLEVRLGESGLGAFLEKKAPSSLSDFKVRLKDERILVEASVKMIFSIDVTATCKLRIVEGKQLFVELEKLDAIGGQSTFGMVQSQLDKINPVLDVKDLPVEAVLNNVIIDNGILTLFGSVSPRS